MKKNWHVFTPVVSLNPVQQEVAEKYFNREIDRVHEKEGDMNPDKIKQIEKRLNAWLATEKEYKKPEWILSSEAFHNSSEAFIVFAILGWEVQNGN